MDAVYRLRQVEKLLAATLAFAGAVIVEAIASGHSINCGYAVVG
jgi:hypothetical protein